MQKIFVDYDSTLNNLDEAWAKWINENYNADISRPDILHWNWIENKFGHGACDFFKDPNIYANEDVIWAISGSKSFINRLCYIYGKENVYIITASANGTTETKDDHIMRNFGRSVLRKNIIHTHDKYAYTMEGILIDDAVHQIEKHCLRNNQLGIVFDRDHMNGWSKADNILAPHEENVRNNLCFAYSYDMILSILGNQEG